MLSTQEIKDRLISLLARTKIDSIKEEALRNDARLNEMSFTSDMKADSLDIVEFIMSVEEEFGIHIPEDDAANIEKFGQMLEYVEAKLKEEASKGESKKEESASSDKS